MKFTYHPEGQEEPKVWDGLKMGRFRAHEIEAVEKRTGLNWGTDFRQALLAGNMLARRAMLWTLLRRDHHTLRFEDLDPFDDEVKVELSSTEWQEAYDDVSKAPLMPGKTEEDREFALAAIQREIDKALTDEAPTAADSIGEAEGKAPSGD